MTYSPGSPGYQPGQPPGSYAAANPFAKPADTASKLPMYLQIAVIVLGLGTYLASFGPMLTVSDSELGGFTGDVGLAVPLAVLAALLAAVGLLPKAKNYAAIIGVVAVLGALLAIARTITKDDLFSVGWGLWLVLAFNVVQAIVAVGVLLLDAGVVTAPVPTPKYDPYAQYGLAPGTGYYGPQQSGYPSYGGYPSGPSTGGYGSPSAPSPGVFGTGSQQTSHHSPPTPPTGFPGFSPPPAGGATTGGQGQRSMNSAQGEQPQSGQGQQPDGGQGQQTNSSAPSGPTPS
jgi:hypothetical protein